MSENVKITQVTQKLIKYRKYKKDENELFVALYIKAMCSLELEKIKCLWITLKNHKIWHFSSTLSWEILSTFLKLYRILSQCKHTQFLAIVAYLNNNSHQILKFHKCQETTENWPFKTHFLLLPDVHKTQE